MKRFNVFLGFLTLAVIILAVSGLFSQQVLARESAQDENAVAQGGLLYDDWSKVVPDVVVPPGNQLIWSRQSTNTLSGEVTWRCVTCHGWDYQGKDGAFRTGPYATGFPGVLDAAGKDQESLIGILSGGEDPQHDFSSLLRPQDLENLASFIQYGLIDDNQYIDTITRKVIAGDAVNGKAKFEETCAQCHGEDGTKLTFRYEGTTIELGTLAVQDPWRFLHRTRFGTARAPEMPQGYLLGWTPQDGRDVVYYAQTTFPTGFESQEYTPEPIQPVENQGGPAQNWYTGILTAFGAMATSLGFAVLVGAALIGIILLLVWIIRSRQS